MESRSFECPPLGYLVELTAERASHIELQHPELLPDHLALLARTIEDPDAIRTSRRMASARLLSRWFEDLRNGKFVVAVVILPEEQSNRAWIVTAYVARSLAPGDLLWTRPL